MGANLCSQVPTSGGKAEASRTEAAAYSYLFKNDMFNSHMAVMLGVHILYLMNLQLVT